MYNSFEECGGAEAKPAIGLLFIYLFITNSLHYITSKQANTTMEKETTKSANAPY